MMCNVDYDKRTTLVWDVDRREKKQKTYKSSKILTFVKQQKLYVTLKMLWK